MQHPYCAFVASLPSGEQEWQKTYHNEQYGFPVTEDNLLFERLVLEINQAGLSWSTILKKQAGFRKAYARFNIKKVAAFNEKDRERLLQDAGIIRNRLKVDAAIYNAQKIVALQKEFGSFYAFLLHHHPMQKMEWVKLFKKHFKFTGGEIVNEFLMSIGLLPGAHGADCPIYHACIQAGALWAKESV